MAPLYLEHIESKLYLHTTRVFPITQSIPFYLSFLSSSSTLAAFMPFGPQTPGSVGPSVLSAGGYQCTRMKLTRQVIVDAKNPNLRAQTASAVQRELRRGRSSSQSGPISSSSEMWDMTTIGEGSFKLFVSLLFFHPLSSNERPFSRVRASQFIGFVISLCLPRCFFHRYGPVLLSFNDTRGLCGVYNLRRFGVESLESRIGLDHILR